MTPQATASSLTVTRRINTDADTLFRAWTTPEELARWSFPEGGTFGGAKVDLRIGGKYTIAMKGPDGITHTAFGTYQVIDKPRKLVYTWDWQEQAGQMGDTIVTVEFKPAGRATDVVITHERFPNDEVKGHHEQGWTSLLNRMEKAFPAA